MIELRQQRGWYKKHIRFDAGDDIVVTNTRGFSDVQYVIRLADIHPFFERNVNRAIGYLFGALFLFACGFLSLFYAQDFPLKLAALVFALCGCVIGTLYFFTRESRYDFFERESGKFLFRIWQTYKGSERQFIEQLLQRIDQSYHNRFIDARQIINSNVRERISEQACYYLYRQGMLDFTELESLLFNIQKRFHAPIDVSNEKFVEKDNVIDFAKYAKEKVVE